MVGAEVLRDEMRRAALRAQGARVTALDKLAQRDEALFNEYALLYIRYCAIAAHYEAIISIESNIQSILERG